MNNIVTGAEVTLINADLYPAPKSIKPTDKKTGTFYIWDNNIVDNKVKITSKMSNVGKAGCITGWVNIEELNKDTENQNDEDKRKKFLAGQKITVKNIKFYSNSSIDLATCIMTGTYYIWSSDTVNNRIRITNYQHKAGMTGFVLAWVDVDELLEGEA